MCFEKDIDALNQALSDTEQRMAKLQSHKESIKDQDSTTIQRLDRNMEQLKERRRQILKEMA